MPFKNKHTMRKITLSLILLSAIIIAFSCKNSSKNDLPANIISNPNTSSNPVNTSNLPILTLKEDFHDFGKLINGEKVSYSFEFTNTGKSILLISDVQSSCGCTVPTYSAKPIKPGETSKITVNFDSEGRIGINNKVVNVFSNCQPPVSVIHIRAEVVNTKDL